MMFLFTAKAQRCKEKPVACMIGKPSTHARIETIRGLKVSSTYPAAVGKHAEQTNSHTLCVFAPLRFIVLSHGLKR